MDKVNIVYTVFFILFTVSGLVWSQFIKARREQPAGMAGSITLVLFVVLTSIFFSAKLAGNWWNSLSWIVAGLATIGYSARHLGMIIRRRNNL